ncbi:MAG TPA: hypothetical protein VFL80_08545 [Thermoanaerobaculia bacterium]|nr:hypothetical protein [Thermoanaerobaculia bacterium]
MIDQSCQRYLEDPESNAGHLAECASCAALFGPPAALPPAPAISIDQLPLAPWEEAGHRPWPFAAGVVLVILAAAYALSSLAGLNPLDIVRSASTPTTSLRVFIASSAEALRNASLIAQLGFAALFVLVNTALFLMLKRPPRGVDA